MNVLLTSCGGPAAVGVIKSIREHNNTDRIIGVDCNSDISSKFLVDKFYKVPYTNSDSYISKINNIIEKENINLILPTSTEDIIEIGNQIEGVVCYYSDSDVAQLCNDKYKFYLTLKDRFSLPITLRGAVFEKPRIGRGSRGLVKHINPSKIYQEYLPGKEYTIDVLCDLESNPLIVIPRERLFVRGGISSRGKIIDNTLIKKECKRLCEYLRIKGPACIQMKEDDNGFPKITEVNPRFGGGTYFTTIAGVNIPGIIIDLINGIKVDIPQPDKIKIDRIFKEYIV